MVEISYDWLKGLKLSEQKSFYIEHPKQNLISKSYVTLRLFSIEALPWSKVFNLLRK